MRDGWEYIITIKAPADKLQEADAVARAAGYNGVGPVLVPGYCLTEGSLYWGKFYAKQPAVPVPGVQVLTEDRP